MPLITPISTKPNYISQEEHREAISTTPNSFSDIPPLLRYSEDNVKVVLEPPLEGFSEEDSQSGTLYIIERSGLITTKMHFWRCISVLAFISASGHGFEVQYPNITLHAVSRDDSGPCVYCQLDELHGGADDEETELNELKIIPSNPATCMRLILSGI